MKSSTTPEPSGRDRRASSWRLSNLGTIDRTGKLELNAFGWATDKGRRMTISSCWLIALSLIAAPGSPADDPQSKAEVDSFRPDPAWKSLGKDVWFDPEGEASGPPDQGRPPGRNPRTPLCQQGDQGPRVDPRDRGPRPDDPRRPAPHRRRPLAIRSGSSPSSSRRPARPSPSSSNGSKAGKPKKVDAREWVKDLGTGKALARDWVFAGSELFEDPRTKTMIYAADDGDLITVANFPASILDLPLPQLRQRRRPRLLRQPRARPRPRNSGHHVPQASTRRREGRPQGDSQGGIEAR